MNKLDLFRLMNDQKGNGADRRGIFSRYCKELGVRRVWRPLRVVWYVGECNVAHWRTLIPAAELAKDPDIEIVVTDTVLNVDLDFADVLFFQRPAGYPTLGYMDFCKDAQKPMLAEVDDWLEDIPPDNPCAEGFKRNRMPETLRLMLQKADVAIFSTDYLAQLYQDTGYVTGESRVLENSIEPELWSGWNDVPSVFGGDAIVIGWAGSGTHNADLAIVQPVLIRLLEEHPEVVFMRAGAGGAGDVPIRGLPPDRYHQIGWENYTESMGKFLRRIDIGIAPLCDDSVHHDFNSGKSSCKALEYFACSIPMVATEIEPYKPHRDHAVLVQNTQQAWYTALKRMIEMPAERKELGAKAHDFVMRECTIQARVGLWKEALFTAAVGKAKRKAEGETPELNVTQNIFKLVDALPEALPVSSDARALARLVEIERESAGKE